MTTYIPESEGIKDEMKEVGVILYVMTGVTAFFAFIMEDPFIIASCIIFGLLAYYVHAKASFTALIIAGVLILIDTILLIPLMALRPASFIFRGYILYAIFSTIYKIYKVRNSDRLIPSTK